jgi:hypothetical protein
MLVSRARNSISKGKVTQIWKPKWMKEYFYIMKSSKQNNKKINNLSYIHVKGSL